VAALYLRINRDVVAYDPPAAAYIVGFTLIAACVFCSRGSTRASGATPRSPIFNITRAVTLTVAVFLAVMFVITRLEALPRSTLLIDWFVLITLLGARASPTGCSRTAASTTFSSAPSTRSCRSC
jgi:O-antigen biosynthesis protein WbqV